MKKNVKKNVLVYAITSMLLALLGSLILTNRIHILHNEYEILKEIVNLFVFVCLTFSLFAVQWWRKLK